MRALAGMRDDWRDRHDVVIRCVSLERRCGM